MIRSPEHGEDPGYHSRAGVGTLEGKKTNMGYVSTPLRAVLAVAVLALTGCPDVEQVDVTDGEDTGTSSTGGDGMMTNVTTQSTITATDSVGNTTDAGSDTTAAMDTTGADDDSTTGTDTGMGTSGDTDCCTPHDSPSCDDKEIAECVCARSAFCCAFEWDAQCVEVAETECGGCGMTEGTTDTTDDGATDTMGTGGGAGTCCDVQATPGCSNSEIETCVCALDEFCCDNSWDGMCVASAIGDCGADCPMVDTCCSVGEAGCSIEEVEDCVCAIDADCCMSGWDGQCVSLSITMCKNDCPSVDIDGEGDCCEPNGTPGCDDPAITQCRCAADPFCCDQEWDQICVNAAAADCDSGCEVPAGDCCLANGTPGCDDMTVQDCTCAVDAFCCDETWDAMCVETAEDNCMLECDAGDCCAANGSPGCNDETVEECTCDLDAFCCDTTWDAMCVGGAIASCMLECPAGDCCEAGFGAGCTDMVVQDCTCDIDSFCCDMQWDAMCVQTAVDNCMLECPAGDCCEANGSPGCDDMEVQDCTCLLDAFCCDNEWDGVCVQAAIDNCMLDCSGGTGSGSGSGGSDSGGMVGTTAVGSSG